MLSAAVGAYYYLRLIVVMYFRPSKEPIYIDGGWPVAVAVIACASLTLILGLYSSPLTWRGAPGRPVGPGPSRRLQRPGRCHARVGGTLGIAADHERIVALAALDRFYRPR